MDEGDEQQQSIAQGPSIAGGADNGGLAKLLLSAATNRFGGGGGNRRGGIVTADKTLANIPGPWNGHALVGSVYDHLSKGDIRRQPYAFDDTMHPVKLLHKQHTPAAGSPVGLFIEQMSRGRTHEQYLNQPDELSAFVAEYNESTATKYFASGDIAYQEKNNGDQEFYRLILFVPQDYLKENAATLFDFRDNDNEIKQYAQVVSFVAKAMSNMSVGISRKRADSQSGVNNNFFRTEDGRIVPRMRVIVEVMFQDDSVNDYFQFDPMNQEELVNFRPMSSDAKTQACSSHNIIGYRIHYLIMDAALHPAACFKTQVWINDRDRCRTANPEGDLENRMRYSVHSKNRSKFLRNQNSMLNDPNLTMQTVLGSDSQQQQQQQSSSISDEMRRANEQLPPEVPDAPPDVGAGVPLPDDAAAPADDAAAGADDGGDMPGFNPRAPIEAAIEGAQRAMAAAVSSNAPHPDDDGRSDDNWGAQAEEVEHPDSDESDEAAAERARLNGEPPRQRKRKTSAAEKQQQKESKRKTQMAAQALKRQMNNNNNSKRSAVDVFRSRIADTIQEPTPKTYFRNVFTLERLSREVYHVYNRAADADLAREYPNGIYAPEGDAGVLQDDDYDLHAMNSPMWFGHTFTFANSVRLAAAAALRRRQSMGNAHDPHLFKLANRVQADINQYYFGPNRYLSMPFPYAAFEYKPQDLDPEINCDFELPWKMSNLDVMLDNYEQKIARRTERILQKRAEGIDVSDLLNSSTSLFSSRDSIDAILGASVSGVGRTAAMGSLDRIANRPASRIDDLITNQKPADIATNITKHEVENTLGGAPSQRTVTPWGSTGNHQSAGSKSKDPSKLRHSSAQTVTRKNRMDAIANYAAAFEAREVVRKTRQVQAMIEHRAKTRHITSESEAMQNTIQQTSESNKRLISELLATIVETDPNGIESANPSKLAEIYRSGNESQRKTLDLLRRMTDASVCDSIALDLEMGGSGRNARQERVRMCDALTNGMGKQSDIVRAKMATTVVEGPVAKSRRRIAKKQGRIIKVVASLPCKNEEEAAQWLKNQREWIIEQERKKYEKSRIVSVDGKAPDPFDPSTVEIKWTPQLEDMYRREELAKLSSMLYEEASIECFGQLTLSNAELSSVHKGMLLAMEDRANDVYFAPQWTIDLSMSRWANSAVHELLMMDSVCNVHQSHLLLYELYKSFRINALRHDLQMGTHLLVVGPPGTEKSRAEQQLSLSSIREGMMSADHTSKLAAFTNKAEDYFMDYQDEARDWLIGDVARMNREQRELRDREKAMISKGNAAYSRNVESKDSKERVTETRVVSRIKAVWANANRVDSTDEDSMLNRFRRIYGIYHRRVDVSLAGRVTAARAKNDNNDANNFYAAKRDEHVVVGIAVTLQNTHALPPVSTELMRIMLSEGEKELTAYTSFSPSARAAMRCFNDVEAYVFNKVYDRQFCSEDSPFIQWSADRKSIETIRPLVLSDFQKLFSSGLYATYEESIFAMTNYFTEMFNLRIFEIMLAAASRYAGFTRDFYHDVYYRYSDRIHLPNVEKRARERGFENADQDSSLIREFHQYESELRFAACQSHPNYPRMVKSKYKTREEAMKAKNSGQQRDYVKEEDLWQDPTFVAIPCTKDDGWQVFINAVSHDFEKIDVGTIKAAIQDYFKKEIRYPLFERVQDPRSDRLKFKGTKTHWDAEQNKWVVDGEVVEESGKILRFVPSSTKGGGEGHLLIPVHFLMNPYHYILQLFITRHENQHTRSVKTVIPIQQRGSPQLLHVHYVRPRHGVVLRMENPHYVPEKIQSALHTDTTNFSHNLASHYIRTSQSRSSSTTQMITFDVDIEFYAFVRHLMDMNYLPNRISPEADAIWNDPKLSPPERFKRMAERHPQRPGACEERIWLRRKQWDFFTKAESTKESVCYPDAFESELEFNRYVQRGSVIRDRRADKERLNEAEVEEYRQYLWKSLVQQPMIDRQQKLAQELKKMDDKRAEEKRELEAASNPNLSKRERKERSRNAQELKEKHDAEELEIRNRYPVVSEDFANKLFRLYRKKKDENATLNPEHLRDDDNAGELRWLTKEVPLESLAFIQERIMYQNIADLLRLSQKSPKALSEQEKIHLKKLEDQLDKYDFVIEYIVMTLRKQDQQRKEKRQAALDEYRYVSSRSESQAVTDKEKREPYGFYVPTEPVHADDYAPPAKGKQDANNKKGSAPNPKNPDYVQAFNESVNTIGIDATMEKLGPMVQNYYKRSAESADSISSSSSSAPAPVSHKRPRTEAPPAAVPVQEERSNFAHEDDDEEQHDAAGEAGGEEEDFDPNPVPNEDEMN